MKIGITGSSAGIGQCICELPFEFVHFNRNDGNIHNAELVYQKLKDCDIFINNVWDNDCQIKLLNYFFNKWRDLPKKIISIGSSVSTYNPSGTGYEGYVDLKRQLRQAHCDIVNLKTTKCKSYLVNPGVTDTKMTVYRKDKKMSTQDVANIVRFVIENKLYIPEIYFYVE